MATVTLSWEEYLKDAEEFLHLSKSIGDNWDLIKKNEDEGNAYLCCKKKVQFKAATLNNDGIDVITECSDSAIATQNNETEVLLMEYHIVYSISYQVPVLYLKIQRSDGSMLEMEEVWKMIDTNEEYPKSRNKMLTVLTQMEHPVLFRPFFAIHPCRTAELLGQTQKSRNFVLTFISLMGPYLKLNLDIKYGLLVDSEEGRNAASKAEVSE